MHPKPPSFLGWDFSGVAFSGFSKGEMMTVKHYPRSCRVHIQKKHRSEQRQQNLCATFLEHRGWFIGNPKSWLRIILIEVAIECYCMLL